MKILFAAAVVQVGLILYLVVSINQTVTSNEPVRNPPTSVNTNNRHKIAVELDEERLRLIIREEFAQLLSEHIPSKKCQKRGRHLNL